MIILVSHPHPTLYSCVESSLCSVISTSSGAVTHSGGELYKAEIPMIGYLWNVTPLTSISFWSSGAKCTLFPGFFTSSKYLFILDVLRMVKIQISRNKIK